MSVKNGSSQTFQNFCGLAYINSKTTYVNQNGVYVPQDAVQSMPSSVFTTGSLLIINPSMDLSLPSYLSNGSIGAYNFQITINYYNNSQDIFDPEICIICANSGIFSSQSGSSQIVINTTTSQASDPVTQASFARTVGGSFQDGILSNVKHIPCFKLRLHKGMSGSGVQSLVK
jgi:hypothetical protein